MTHSRALLADVLDELLYYITTGNSDGAVGFYGENANEFLSKI